MYFIPKNLIVQQLSIKEKVNKTEINRMRNGYIVDTLTSVDIQKIVKSGRKVIEIYDCVIYRENFKISLFTKVIDKLFELRQNCKDDNNDVLQLLVILIMNSLYGEQLPKDFDERYSCKSEIWMMTENDERVLDYQNVNYGNYIVKKKDDPGLVDEVKKSTPCLSS